MSRRLRISRLRSIDRRITVMCLNATEARTFPAGRGEHDTVKQPASLVCAMEPSLCRRRGLLFAAFGPEGAASRPRTLAKTLAKALMALRET